MTFTIPDNAITLVLEDPPYAGAEIEVRLNVPFFVWRDTVAWFEKFRTADVGSAEETQALETAYRLFVDEGLIGWNLADHTGALPTTMEGMWRLPLPLAAEIVGEWLRAVRMPPAPLAEGSPSSEPDSPAGSTPRRARKSASRRS